MKFFNRILCKVCAEFDFILDAVVRLILMAKNAYDYLIIEASIAV